MLQKDVLPRRREDKPTSIFRQPLPRRDHANVLGGRRSLQKLLICWGTVTFWALCKTFATSNFHSCHDSWLSSQFSSRKKTTLTRIFADFSICNFVYYNLSMYSDFGPDKKNEVHLTKRPMHNYMTDIYNFFVSGEGPRPPHSRGFWITHNDAPQSIGLLWTSDQLVAKTSTWQHNTHNRQMYMPPLGFEPTISAGERPQTYTLDRAVSGTGLIFIMDAWNSRTEYFFV